MKRLPDGFLAAAILLSDADKGGVGKSFLIRLLAYLLTFYDHKWIGFDLDPRNGHLLRFHKGFHVTQYDWTDPRSWDQLCRAISLADPSHCVLVDLPAQTGAALMEQYPRLVATAAYLKRPLYRFWTMTPEFDSLNLLAQSMHLVSCNQTIAVRNLRTASEADFGLWESSATRQALLSAGGMELCMPKLSTGAAKAIESQDLPFIKASHEVLEPWFDYDVQAFLRVIQANFAPFLERLRK